jgi:hypothetical protein
MGLSISVYNNVNSISKTISVDLVGDILAASNTSGVSTTNPTYYFKFTTSAKDTDDNSLGAKISLSLSDLALNHQKQSASNTAAAYADIKSMVVDYVYDYIYGHTANQYGSGCTEQLPMQL